MPNASGWSPRLFQSEKVASKSLGWAKVETLNQQELVIKQQKYYLPAIIIVIVINGFFKVDTLWCHQTWQSKIPEPNGDIAGKIMELNGGEFSSRP